MTKRTDGMGGTYRAHRSWLAAVGGLLALVIAAPTHAEPEEEAPGVEAPEEAAPDEAAPDEAAPDEAAPDEDEAADDEAPKIRAVASNRHMLVKARSLRLTEKAGDRLLLIARQFHDETRRQLVITGGERNAERQAQLMYKKLDHGEDLIKLYARDDLVRPIISAYKHGKQARHTRKRTLRSMTDVIQTQVDQKQYVSRHLAFTAVDVRSRDMTPKAESAFREAVKAVPGVILIDERKSATPCFHLSM